MNKDNLLIDCRGKDCKLAYSSIIEYYKSLNTGQAIFLITNKNPKKLYYEMMTKERGSFYWTFFEDGPTEWEVMIEKVS